MKQNSRHVFDQQFAKKLLYRIHFKIELKQE